jgi:hypothetical protein
MRLLARILFEGGIVLYLISWILACAGLGTMAMVRITLGMMAFGAALACLTNVFSPPAQRTLGWKGSPPLRCGWLSAFGFGLAFGSFAVGIVTLGWVPKPYGLIFVAGFLAGWVLCVIGFLIDRRRHAINSEHTEEGTEAQTG